MNKPVSAGSIVETRCTRCRKVLNHTIVAMVGEKIVRVECNTCHGTHNYRPLKEASTTVRKKEPTTRKAKIDPVAAACAEWSSLQSGMEESQAIPYEMTGIYRVKNLVKHPMFGLGIVQLVIPPNKIEVLFEQGTKKLRCG